MNKRIIALISAVAMLSTACGSAANQPQTTTAATSAETAAETEGTAAETTAAQTTTEQTTTAAETKAEKQTVSLADIKTMKRPSRLFAKRPADGQTSGLGVEAISARRKTVLRSLKMGLAHPH